MEGINIVCVSGNLTRAPETRQLQGGNSVTNMRIAVNERTKRGGDWVDKANFFDVTVWGAQGEVCSQYLDRGSGVVIQGRLSWREWEAKDGTKRQTVEIVADRVRFMGGPSDNGGRSGGRSDAEAAPAMPRTDPTQDDDDIPF